jgi:hypothetical protein
VVPITLICDRCHTMVGRGCGTIGAANEGTHYEDDSRLFTEHERNDVGTGPLSCDPSLSFRPDPAFRAKFRNPDELVEEEPNTIEASMRTVATTSATWVRAAAWRRSPKD